MSTPDQFVQPPTSTDPLGGEAGAPQKAPHRILHMLEIAGALLALVVLGWAIFTYTHLPSDTPPEAVPIVVTPEMKQEMVDAMSQKAPVPVKVTPAEQQAIIDAMSQKAPAPTTGTVSGGVQSPAPTMSAAEKQKLIDAMMKKSP